MLPHHPHGLDLGMHPELGEDVLHMALHGERADAELEREFGRRSALGKAGEDLAFATGEGRESLGSRRRRTRAPQPVHQAREILGRQHELTGVGSTEDVDQGAIALRRKETTRARGEGERGRVGPGDPGRGEHAHVGSRVTDRAHDLDAAPIEAIQIDEHQIGTTFVDHLERLRGVRDGTEDTDRPGAGKREQESLRQFGTVVDDENADMLDHPGCIGIERPQAEWGPARFEGETRGSEP